LQRDVRLADNLADQHQAALVAQLLARVADLPDDQRAALHLVALEGLSYRQPAETMDVRIGTVMSRLNRARTSPTRSCHCILRDRVAQSQAIMWFKDQCGHAAEATPREGTLAAVLSYLLAKMSGSGYWIKSPSSHRR
jgi:predicted DNA-binding protein (UPF0251 family)